MGLEHLLLGLCAADKRLMSSSKLDCEKARRLLREHRTGSPVVSPFVLELWRLASTCAHTWYTRAGACLCRQRPLEGLRYQFLICLKYQCQACICSKTPQSAEGLMRCLPRAQHTAPRQQAW